MSVRASASRSFDLLRRHIRDGAEHRALLGQFEALRGSLDGLLAFEVPQFCEPEIEEFHSAGGEHDVARLQIAMNHALPVGGVESPGDLGRRERAPDRREPDRPLNVRRASLPRAAPSRETAHRRLSPTSWMVQMCGWVIRAIARASR